MLRIREPRGAARSAAAGPSCDRADDRSSVGRSLDSTAPTRTARCRWSPATVEVVSATLLVRDAAGHCGSGSPTGLERDHPRFPPRVLADGSGEVRSTRQPGESRLVRIAGDWGRPLQPELLLTGLTFRAGPSWPGPQRWG